MTANVYRFNFESGVPLCEAELTLHLAIYAIEGLHGEAHVRLDVNYRLDQSGNAIIVDAGTNVGAALVRVFTQLLIRQYGEGGFQVRRVDAVTVGRSDFETPTRRREASTPAA